MLNYAAKLGPRSSYRFFEVAPRASKPRVIASLPVGEPAYMHSFGLTERWFVLVEFPHVVNPLALALSGRPYIENYRWKPELGTRFTLVDRASGEAGAGFETDACFAFHHVNGYEDGGEVVVDLCTYPDAGVIEDLYLDRLRAGKPVQFASLTRFRLRLADRSVRREAADRGAHRAAAHQLRALQRAPLSLRLGQQLRRDHGWIERIVKVDTTDGATLLLVGRRVLSGRAGVRRPPRSRARGRRGAAVGRARRERRDAPSCSCSTPPT